MNIKNISVDLIVEGYHPRKDYSGQEELTKRIKNTKTIRPIIVRPVEDNYEIIDGKRRFLAAKELGWTEIPCIIEEIDEETATHQSYLLNLSKYRKNLNALEEAHHLDKVMVTYGHNVENLVRLGYGSRSTIDDKLRLLKLSEKIQHLVLTGEIDRSFGYELGKLKDENLQQKLADEIIANKKVSVRDIKNKVRSSNVRGNHKNDIDNQYNDIPKGDIPDVFIKDAKDMSELKDGSVGCVITSPPFNVGLEYEKDVTFEGHVDNLGRVFKECNRVLAPGGKICVNVGDIRNFGTRNGGKPEIKPIIQYLVDIFKKYNIRYLDTIIWKKGLNWVNNRQVKFNVKHTTHRILGNFEYFYIFTKDGERDVSFDIEYESKLTKDEWKKWVDGVWEIRPVSRQKGHPAQFPEKLVRRLIKLYSFKGDIVLDPFGGSMTTVKVANELGRVGIGYERDERYKSFIMEKLGIKAEDIVTPEENAHSDKTPEETESVKGPLNRIVEIANDIGSLQRENGVDIRSIKIPVSPDVSIDDAIVDCVTEQDEPDPDSPGGLQKVLPADEYDKEETVDVLSRVSNDSPLLLPAPKPDISPYINKVLHGDCIDGLRRIPDNSVDNLVTDPPYGMKFMVKNWDKAVPSVDVWKECLRVLKPGAFAFVMSIPRQDCLSRMILNLEKAGFRVDYTPLYWTYATGFPKAMNIGKAIDKRFEKTARITKPTSIERKELEGSYGGFQPKPAVEVIIVAMKPMDEKTFVNQALKNGKGITWLDDCRIPYNGEPVAYRDLTKQKSSLGNDKGRFPANLLVSNNVLGNQGGYSRYFSLDAWAEKNVPFLIVPKASKKEKNVGLDCAEEKAVNDGRKKSIDNPFQRGITLRKNHHPTVKPIQLMSYLITMGSRENDVVLDPFCGSGSTCIAAKTLNRKFIGIELNEEYRDIAVKRLDHVKVKSAA